MTACRDSPRTTLSSRLRAVLIAPKAFSVRVLDMMRGRGESAGARLAGRLGFVVVLLEVRG